MAHHATVQSHFYAICVRSETRNARQHVSDDCFVEQGTRVHQDTRRLRVLSDTRVSRVSSVTCVVVIGKARVSEDCMR
jgi:hypothetical protein